MKADTEIDSEWESRMQNPDIPPILLALRSPAEHTARRRIWARGFTAGATKEYHHSIITRANQLVGILAKESSKRDIVDISKWIGCFTFDFMGDMVYVLSRSAKAPLTEKKYPCRFSGGFELMSETKDHEFKELMHKNLQ